MGKKKHHHKQKSNSTDELKSELFRCDTSPVYGRFLVSKVEIKKGDLILKEKCLLAGPHLTTNPICIGCHSELLESQAKLKCSKCNWPICTLKCEDSDFHKNECNFFKERNIKSTLDRRNYEYGAITIIRALLLKLKEPDKWKRLISLENHNETRQTLPEWKIDEMLIDLIQNKWDLKEIATDGDIHSVCGVLQVNSFEMGDCYTFGGIFPIAAMISHNCIPNASQSEIIDEASLEIRATVDIPAGAAITLCYEACLKGTTLRQNELWKSKYFKCTCDRCSDSTELGTHLSTLICSVCRKGLVTKDAAGGWTCAKCRQRQDDKSVEEIISKYIKISDALTSIPTREEFLPSCKLIFHPNHFIPLGIKYSLCLAYGHDEGYTISELSQSEAQRKLDLCTEVLKILNILTPGNNVVRGNILYEYQAAQVLLARNLLESGKCSKGLIKRRLQNTMDILLEAIDIFKLNYATRLLGESAERMTLMELKTWIKSI